MSREPSAGTRRFSLARISLLQRFAVVSFVAFVILGLAISYSLGRSVQRTALQNATRSAEDDLNGPLRRAINKYDFSRPLTRKESANIQWVISQFVQSNRTVEVKLWRPDGTLLYAAREKSLVGKKFELEDDIEEALDGETSSDVSSLDEAENRNLQKQFGQLFQVYMPVRVKAHGPVVGAFEIYQTYKPVASEISNLQHNVYGMTAAGLLVLYLLLYGTVRRGSNTIKRQQEQLVGYTVDLEQSYNETIGSLAAAVDARDSTTERHAERVTELAVELGRWIGMSDDELRSLERGALLHDVGKIGVSDLILLKPGKLTEGEWRQMRHHPIIGHEMLHNVSFLQAALPVVRHHHERWDGDGYPDKLRGEWIPTPARLFAVIDVYDALTSDRPYRAAMTDEQAMTILIEGKDTHFDPKMVDAFREMMKARAAMQDQVRDLLKRTEGRRAERNEPPPRAKVG